MLMVLLLVLQNERVVEVAGSSSDFTYIGGSLTWEAFQDQSTYVSKLYILKVPWKKNKRRIDLSYHELACR